MTGFTHSGRLSLQNSPEKFAGAAAKLALRERQELCNLHAAGERIRDLRQHHEICGAGQKEAAWALIRIHAALDGQQNFRCALNLIDDRPVETPNETFHCPYDGQDRSGPKKISCQSNNLRGSVKTCRL